MATSLPKFPAPYRYPADAEYVVARHSLLVGGVMLHKGDRLPADSPVRRIPRRLEALCRQRQLEPQVKEVQRVEAKKTAIQAPTLQASGVNDLTLEQLREECSKRGLVSKGNRAQLRKRLRAVLE